MREADGARGKKKAREGSNSKLLLGQRVSIISFVPTKCTLPFPLIYFRRAGNFVCDEAGR